MGALPLPAKRTVGAGLVHAALIEPGSILAIHALDVLGIGFSEETEQGAHLHLLSVLYAVSGLENLREDALMLATVLIATGKEMLLEQMLLAFEVHARELDEPVEHLADLFPAHAADHRESKFVHGIHEDTVLIIHGSDADCAGVVPG